MVYKCEHAKYIYGFTGASNLQARNQEVGNQAIAPLRNFKKYI